MNTSQDLRNLRGNLPIGFVSTITVLLVLASAGQVHSATNAVTSLADSGPGSLRQVIENAAAGDSILFGVTGTISLASGELVVAKNLAIYGPGPTNLSISGNHQTRILSVPNGVSATISGFTLRDGHSPDGADGVVFSEGNVSPGTPGEPGGALSTAGTLTVSDCIFRNNAAGRGGNGAPGEFMRSLGSRGANGGAGGAIYSKGSLTLTNCLLYQNASGAGGASGVEMTFSEQSGQGGPGGAICSSGTLSLFNTVITNNQTGSGAGTPLEAAGGDGGCGGGVWCSASLTANGSKFLGNSTGSGGYAGRDSYLSGDGGMGGSGGGIWCGGFLALTNCVVSANYCGGGGSGGDAPYAGNGGSGGPGCGICCTNGAVLVHCMIIGNHGGTGGSGGDALPYYIGHSTGGGGGSSSSGAGIYASGNLILTGCTVSSNFCGNGGGGGQGEGWDSYAYALAGAGGAGGFGGGICALLDLTLTNCTVSDNTSGDGGQGGNAVYPFDQPGDNGAAGKGGGIYRASGTNLAVLASCSIARNLAGLPGGPNGENGTGGGVWSAPAGLPPRPFRCLNTIIALNSGEAPDVCGSFISLGHNLIGVTNGGTSFGLSDDRVGSSAAPLDPKLGPLADNGGNALTLALLSGSPAIDAGTGTGVPPTDQRGFPRPAGEAFDIGAFEYGSVIPTIALSLSGNTGVNIVATGNTGRTCRLLCSPDFSSWVSFATNQIGNDGTVPFYDTFAPGSACRFYRLVMP